jgi:hypothetical protein
MGVLSIILIIGLIIVFFNYSKLEVKLANLGNKRERESLQNFESRINNWGFTKCIVVYDFIQNGASAKKIKNLVAQNDGLRNSFTVGLWLNYQKRIIALRLDRDAQKEIEISFDKIQSFEIIENGYTKFSGGAVGYGGIAIGGGKSKDISTGLQVRIVSGGINTGTQAYFVKLMDPIVRMGFNVGSRCDKSNPYYQDIQECARSIADELENILRNS